ncbi:RNA polymerase-associated protein RTF1 [Toxoplasma gondii RUB]|uniref:RNA polymerase-associated protein RTF1 n=8 Tax=Toxoplasma gondii TaxID=5811 RepID=B9QJP2_TOXGV|nr:RNA polymerase-associated protein RTF1 [Toxoplasma gondii VEG]KFG60306.1 RNA polymerase-associated protein RTF1 [Toxoplasma gondii RUB]PUA87349.1 RNA polymerase-associated protein RTF1 [Toxoplasma gondii TgCATBr9]CEL73203.1 TPA: RNA polymerase-associated protein RTF1 [Toxoplasma gondii VEG]
MKSAARGRQAQQRGRPSSGSRASAEDEGKRHSSSSRETGGDAAWRRGKPGDRNGEFSPDLLYKDERDREALESMNEFEREAELARRYEELVRERQRKELLRRQDQDRKSKAGRLGDALSDIRARRARQKQQQRQTSEDEDEEEGEVSGSRKDGTEDMTESSSEDEEDEEEKKRLASPPVGAGGPGASSGVSAAADAAVGSGASAAPLSPDRGEGAGTADGVALGVGSASAGDASVENEALGRRKVFTAKSAREDEGGEPTTQQQRPVEDDRRGDLFDEDRVDSDEQRRKETARRMLQRISLELLNGVRLSTERLLHMLEHPQAEKFVRGCFVKVPQPAAAASKSPSPESPPVAWVCQIVGLRPCAPYFVPKASGTLAESAGLGAESRRGSVPCAVKLLLRVAPKASAKFDREFSLAELLNSPVTPAEYEGWKKKLQEFDSVEDLSKKLRAKLQQLKEFTFTDEDVQAILSKKQDSGAGSFLMTTGTLLKQLMSIKHEMDSLHASLSSVSTASAARRELKEKLQVLVARKAEVEAKLAKSKAAAGRARNSSTIHQVSVERRREKLSKFILNDPKRSMRKGVGREPSKASPPAATAAALTCADLLFGDGEEDAGRRKRCREGSDEVGRDRSHGGGDSRSAENRLSPFDDTRAASASPAFPSGGRDASSPRLGGESEHRSASPSSSQPRGVAGPLSSGTPQATAAWKFLLHGAPKEQRVWVKHTVQRYREGGPLNIDTANIPPPRPYASVVALLPPTPPPPSDSLLISLEEYKQQVAQLANMQLAG